MKNQLLINQISLIIATSFLIISAFGKSFELVLLGLVMIVYSNLRIKKIKVGSRE